MRGKRRPSEPFASVLSDVRDALKLSHVALAALLGVTPRTITRWVHHGELPAVSARYGIVHALARRVDGAAGARLARSLGVADDVKGPYAPDGDPARALLADAERALLAAAEQVDESPRRVRQALVTFLARLEGSGYDLAAVRRALAPDA